MTNDIAIRFCDEYLARHISDIDKEFLKKAKEALQQESCEDAISRQAVLDAINTDWHEDLSQLEDTIKALPPVEPKQKMGHWIFIDKAKEHARCSECGYGEVDLFNGKLHNYCEQCGVKMQEVKDNG